MAIYHELTPLQRLSLNNQLKRQRFPHFFNRNIRPFNEFANIESSELKNLLFYGLSPSLQTMLPLEKLAHLALYVCSIRLFHGQPFLGIKTGNVADQLLSKFYQDHESFYNGLQNYVLHLHAHYSIMYKNHGALSNIGCFGQEDLIGYISSGHHGTRYYGEFVTQYYNIDFAIHNKKPTITSMNGPRDRTN